MVRYAIKKTKPSFVRTTSGRVATFTSKRSARRTIGRKKGLIPVKI